MRWISHLSHTAPRRSGFPWTATAPAPAADGSYACSPTDRHAWSDSDYGPASDDVLLKVTSTQAPPGLRLIGEVDISTLGLLTEGLGEAVRKNDGGRGDVHAHVGGMTFIDVGGLRAFVTAARSLNRDGHNLVVHAFPNQFGRHLRMLGWDTAPGLLLHCALPARVGQLSGRPGSR